MVVAGTKLRPWTALERERLRLWYREKVPLAEVARRLGRTRTQVYGAVVRFCRDRARHRRLDDYARRIRTLHSRGHTSNEIARRLGLSTGSLHYWMRRHGLAANGKDPGVFRAVKRREYARVWRGESLTDARVAVHAAEAARRGWPQARTPRQADVLDLLEAGPLPTKEIAARLGVDGGCHGRYGYPSAKQHLGNVAALGLITRERCPADGRVTLWRLADGVRRHVAARDRGDGPVPAEKPRGEGAAAKVCRVVM